MRISPLALAALAAASGCQGHEAPRPGDAAAPKPPAAAPVAAPAPAPDGVTVLSAGAEPRRELRYHPAKGTTSPFVFETNLDLQSGAAAALTGTTIPTVIHTGSLVVEDVLPNGDLRVHIHVDHVTAKDRPGSKLSADATAAQMKMFEGFDEAAVLSATGHLRDVKIDLPHASAAQQAQLATLTDSLAQLALPLPAQAVGVGAVWTTSRPYTVAGVTMTTTSTITLGALAGERVTYQAATQITGGDQHADVGGVGVDVHHIAGRGGGDGAVDLATLAVGGTATLAFHVDLATGDQTMQMGMTMTVAINPS